MMYLSGSNDLRSEKIILDKFNLPQWDCEFDTSIWTLRRKEKSSAKKNWNSDNQNKKNRQLRLFCFAELYGYQIIKCVWGIRCKWWVYEKLWMMWTSFDQKAKKSCPPHIKVREILIIKALRKTEFSKFFIFASFGIVRFSKFVIFLEKKTFFLVSQKFHEKSSKISLEMKIWK